MYLYKFSLRYFVLKKSRLTIICFHSVGGGYPFSVAKDEFQNLIISLIRNYTILNPSEFSMLYSSRQTFPKKSILLTFDDGFIDNYEIGLWLAELNISVIFFVCGGILKMDDKLLEVFNRDRRMSFSFSDFMTETHLKTLLDRGHFIGNHFYSHTYLDERNISQELLDSISTLNQKKIYTQFLALPYGRIENYSRKLLLGLKAAGYIVFSMDPSPVSKNRPYLPAMPRVGIGLSDFDRRLTMYKINGAFRFRSIFRGNFKN